MRTILLSLMLLCLSMATAQEKVFTVTVKSGDDINQMMASSKYLFTDFQLLTLLTRQGSVKVMMNYNMLTDEMMFIHQSGDTLALANPEDVNTIRFGKREFVHTNKGYLEVLADNGSELALLVSRRIKASAVRNPAGYGSGNATASNKNVSVLLDNNSVAPDRMTVSREVTYAVTCIFYLQVRKSFYVASKRNFVRAFGKTKEDLIHQYIQDNALNLKNETHLLQLFNFCSE